MKLTRRQLTLLSLLGLSVQTTAPMAFGAGKAQGDSLKILILGGTGFLGPHIVRHGLERGHTLTLFNRGKTDPHLFPEVEKLVGDRNTDLESLKNRKWDVVIDTSSSFPTSVAKSVDLLKPNVGQYLYVSSTAVYSDWTKPNIEEDASIFEFNATTLKTATPFERYGANKALCESTVRDAFGGKSTLVRPNAIEGPGLRRHILMPYWVRRTGQGGETMGPGAASDTIQFIDARDLAQWLVYCAENAVTGTFNATSAQGAYSMQDLIKDCQAATEKPAPIVWVDSSFLVKQGFFAIPYWVRNRDEVPGFGHLNTDLANKNGLKPRPQIETAQLIHEWLKTLTPEQQAFSAGIPLQFEQKVIASWKAENSQTGA